MADQIPDGITRDLLIAAISSLDKGFIHPFAKSTGYDVLYKGRRYPPKAVVGVAANIKTGEEFGPYHFKGGLKSKCFRLLQDNGFEIVTKGDTNPFPEEVSDLERHLEGSITKVTVNKYERNPEARAKCIKHFGSTCQVCDFDFVKKYGDIGQGFIHVHHIKQLADIGEEYEVDPTLDLVPVCPNCHSMLHKRNPPFTIRELRDLIELLIQRKDL